MLNAIIALSLKNRAAVLALAIGVALFGAHAALTLPIDVFPDLNRPTVTVMTEAPGLAPEEVEALVTFPIETVMNGATGVQRVRSASGVGLSIVWVEFDWGTDIYVDRQIVAEKLQMARERLPEGTVPHLAPISSIMGEILLLGITSSDGKTSPLQMRTIADWTVRPRLLAIPGVSQVTVMGGGVQQIQVLTSPERLAAYDVTLDQLTRAVSASNVNKGGGFLESGPRELLIRITGRAGSLDEVAGAVVAPRETSPVRVRDVADVVWGHPVPRGDGSVNGAPAVILSVQKQPNADTIALTRAIDRAVEDLSRSICSSGHSDVVLHRDLFRQEEFIRSAIRNVQEAIRDGVFWVILVLFVFLWNLRTSFITITAIPLTILLTAILFRLFGMSVNTMTLGGLAVAVGELVDDSIVDIENIFRRLKENRRKPVPEPALRVVFRASSEVRNSIVYATAIVVLVVVPLFFLSGLEGRMFLPLGLAYLLTLVMSLVVSLTVTPVLASYLLPKARFMGKEGDSALVRRLKRVDEKVLRATLRHPYKVLAATAALVLVSIASFGMMGMEFLPPFNEGTFTLNLRAAPGTSLAESNRLGTIAEGMLREVPEVVSTARRTGRAEMDEHAEGVHNTEIEVRMRPDPLHVALFRAADGVPGKELEALGEAVAARLRTLPEVAAAKHMHDSYMVGEGPTDSWDLSGSREKDGAPAPPPGNGPSRDIAVDLRFKESSLPGMERKLAEAVKGLPAEFRKIENVKHTRDEVAAHIRDQFASLPGVDVNLGQPISHRLDHIMSGIRAQVAVKLFGPDLLTLRAKAHEIQDLMAKIPGVVDLQVEPQVEVPQLRIRVKKEEAAQYGLTVQEVAEALETALRGTTVSQVLYQQRVVDLVVWYDAQARGDPETIRQTLLSTPLGRRIALSQVAEVVRTTGPNTIHRESAVRRIVVSCNVAGRDLGSVAQEIQDKVGRGVALPAGYYVEYGGQFEAQREAGVRLLGFGLLCGAGIFGLLVKCLGSWQAALQCMVNIPLAAVGAAVALCFTSQTEWSVLRAAPVWQWPKLWLGGITLSVASLVGLITLTGIVVRNGIMMISHYLHLMRYEGERFDERMVIRGSLERLVPVLMTAATTIIGLIPLLLGAGETGKEILHPLAVVVVGGLVSSTLLDQVVTPALFRTFGKNAAKAAERGTEDDF